MPFFTYHQNNSGGFFVIDPDAGVSHNVIIEADSVRYADEYAKTALEIYFDGVEKGIDCMCCGDRWYRLSSTGDDTPSVYDGHTLGESMRVDVDANVYVHYLDGSVVGYQA